MSTFWQEVDWERMANNIVNFILIVLTIGGIIVALIFGHNEQIKGVALLISAIANAAFFVVNMAWDGLTEIHGGEWGHDLFY